MNEVIAHRGKTARNQECTPGYYNFEGEVRARMQQSFEFGRTVDPT